MLFHGVLKLKCNVLCKENVLKISCHFLEQNQLNTCSRLHDQNFIYSLNKDPSRTSREKLPAKLGFFICFVVYNSFSE